MESQWMAGEILCAGEGIRGAREKQNRGLGNMLLWVDG